MSLLKRGEFSLPELTTIYQNRTRKLTLRGENGSAKTGASPADKEEPVSITRDGEVIAFYLESEIVCAQCATDAERADTANQETLAAEELEGAVDELWCDRCDASLMTGEQAACCG